MTGRRTDLAWMERQVSALYVGDDRGRLVASRVSGDLRVPRLLVGLTPEGSLWRMRADLDAALVRELARLLGAERPTGDGQRPERLATLRERLEGEAPIESESLATAFRVVAARADEDGVIELGPEDADRVDELLPGGAALGALLPAFGIADSGRIVSAAWCATPFQPSGQGEAAGVVAGFATLSGFAGHGLEAAALSAWSRAIRALGALPLGLSSGRATPDSSVIEPFGTILRIE